MRIKDKSKILCEWILYDSRTICPKEHSDKCDGSRDKPFWRIDAGYRKNLTYCPYCGKKIDYSKINKEIDYD